MFQAKLCTYRRAEFLLSSQISLNSTQTHSRLLLTSSQLTSEQSLHSNTNSRTDIHFTFCHIQDPYFNLHHLNFLLNKDQYQLLMCGVPQGRIRKYKLLNTSYTNRRCESRQKESKITSRWRPRSCIKNTSIRTYNIEIMKKKYKMIIYK